MSELMVIISVMRRQWLWMTAGVLVSVGVIAANSLLMAVSGWFITSMAVAGAGKLTFNYFLPSATIRALAITRTVGRYVERLVTHNTTFLSLAQLRCWLFTRLAPLSPGVLENYSSGELYGRMRADIDSLENLYLRIIAPVITGCTAIILATAFVFWWSGAAAMVLVSTLVTVGIIIPLLVRRLSVPAANRAAVLTSELRTRTSDGFQGGAELLLLGAVDRFVSTVETLSAELIDEQRQLALISAKSQAVTVFAAGFGVTGVLLMSAMALQQGAVDGPALVMLLLFSAAAFESVSGMSAAMQLYPSVTASARRITELAGAAVPVAEPDIPLPLGDNAAIIFSGVSFQYADRPLLQNFCLEIPAGSKVAITGPSGCGKSTIVEILLRFRSYSGHISVGGKELSSVSSDEMLMFTTALPQHPHLFNTSIRENIVLSRPTATDEEIAAVLYDSALDEWLAGLPEGLETAIGEGAMAVSGGEMRRIALARALLKQSPLVILDEPTEGLDAATERKLIQRLKSRLAAKTVILITHRPQALELADRLIKLEVPV